MTGAKYSINFNRYIEQGQMYCGYYEQYDSTISSVRCYEHLWTN